MGRTKYSDDTIHTIMATFVSATREIIDEKGIAGASIRRIAERAGYSSGTLYLYFDDLNELITMALITSLKDYIDELFETSKSDETNEERYCRAWRIFCKHAFSHPQEYNELFFGSKSESMDAIAKKYYELFPEELQYADGYILEMLERGSLVARNKAVLVPLGAELGLSEHDIEVANGMTVSYFRYFLDAALNHDLTDAEIEEQTNLFMEGALFVLHRS